ncbi:hypothetical protein [Methanosphaerula palustris]|uniref:hypothetical protein n=1 Tax=Methanosphaerula palustris TaxID=475088 RepID=UPI00018493B5|nr:hypothetical protein [Methanosphaerula palustris]
MILGNIGEPALREYDILKTIEHGWSRNILALPDRAGCTSSTTTTPPSMMPAVTPNS